MKLGRRALIIFIFLLLGLLLLVAVLRPPLPTSGIGSAQSVAGGYHIGDEEGDFVSLGLTSAITLPAGTRIAGDAALATLGGQPIVVEGSVGGDLTVLGGDITLAAGSVVSGDVFAIGGGVRLLGQIDGDVSLSGDRLTIGEGARISGKIDACDVRDIDAPAGLEVARCPQVTMPVPFLTTFAAGIGILLASGVSALAVIVLPRQIAQIEDAMRRRPLRLSGAGVALIALFIGICAALALVVSALPPLGFVGVPLFLLMLLALAIMALLGTVPIYIAVGEWLLRRFGGAAPPLVAVLVGAVAINGGLALLSFVPVLMWVGALISLGMLILSLGASFDTQLGTRRRERSYFVQG